MVTSNCAVCDSKKSKFMKEKEAGRLLSKFAEKITDCK